MECFVVWNKCPKVDKPLILLWSYEKVLIERRRKFTLYAILDMSPNS